MKIAVVDHVGNPGGGSRVVRALLPAMKRVGGDVNMTFFGNPHSIKREQLERVFTPCSIKIKPLASVRFAGRDLFNIRGSRHVVSLIQRKVAPLLSPFSYSLSGAVERELAVVTRGFDIAFFTWPFHLRCPDLACPMVGIFHDFNFKYLFSGQPMVPWVVELLNQQTPLWLSKATPVVSTDFMRRELRKFYPEYGDKTRVVPVAPTSMVSQITEKEAKEIVLRRFKIQKKYLLCPTNICSHKNSGALLAALPLLKKRGHDLVLLFVGWGTEAMNGRASSCGLEIGCMPQDVYGLGYVCNEEIDALIQCAAVVVNPSLYEGGNVPGFDAWERGVPVAMSHIPPFLEHLAVHDVRAEVFDPRSPEDIAEKIDRILSHPEKAAQDAAHSRQAISHFTWERTAEGYLAIFDTVLRK